MVKTPLVAKLLGAGFVATTTALAVIAWAVAGKVVPRL